MVVGSSDPKMAVSPLCRGQTERRMKPESERYGNFFVMRI
jgi:hypothetical protein